MLRLYRKTIFPRWHVNRKNSEKKSQNLKHSKQIVLCAASQKENHSNQDHQKKQHADKQDKRCWDDPQFHFNFFRTSLLETAGWLGTAALYASYQLKKIHNIFEYDRINSSCIFSNIVLAMPKCIQNEKSLRSVPDSISLSPDVQSPAKEKVTSDVDILESIKNLTDQYIAAVKNTAGIKNINKNDKKAFRYFQTAARLGSSQGFYNLGLCYHLGKGTRVNLNMAAFCYRKAALKGHALASFNLAVFFHKGMGGLPVDTKIAKELLAEAAEKGVPEAQLYFGIEFLEEKRWQEAVMIFTNLAEKNVPEAQYYLGLCYESGLGVEKNKKLAVELLTKSASQGYKKAILKLKNLPERDISGVECSSIKSTVVNSIERNNLHVSASVPELGAFVKKSVESTANITISSYLGLITPFLIVNKNESKSKGNFFTAENNIVKDCSSTFLPFRGISVVMQVKT